MVAKYESHPKSNLHYIHVIKDDDPAFDEWYKSYRVASRSISWMSTISTKLFTKMMKDKNSLYYKSNILFIVWNPSVVKVGTDDGRMAKLAARYTELVGDLEVLPKLHCQMLDRFKERNMYDFIFVNTPYAIQFFDSSKTFYAPYGYCKQVFGSPNFDTRKKHDLIFYGGIVEGKSRRLTIISNLSRRLRHRFERLPGVYGSDRQNILNKSRAILHIQQAADTSFTTMRLWHAVASSAVMLVEPMDASPAVAGRHYIEIPKITDNWNDVARAIDEALDIDLTKIARCAHDELSKYTIEYCMENYVVPATC